MKKKIIYIILILIAIILQTSVFPIFLNTNAAVDVVLMLILALSIIDGFFAFWGWSIAAGILYDLATYSIVGKHVIIFLLVIYLASFFSRRFSIEFKGTGLVLFAAFVIAAMLISRGVFTLMMAGDIQTMRGFWQTFGDIRFLLLGVIYNEIIFFIWFFVLRKMKKFFGVK